MREDIVLYHANCMDGFAAAAVAYKFLENENAVFVPMQYGDLVPDCTDKRVYMLDFSYKTPAMLEILHKAHSVVVLDHHKTAQAELQDLAYHTKIALMFDMEHSGAYLAWRWFSLDPVPDLIRYIEDRDLWKWKLPGSKELAAFMWSFPFLDPSKQLENFKAFHAAIDAGDEYISAAIRGGADILRYMRAQTEFIASRHYPIEFTDEAGHTYYGACCNATSLFSEVGEYLCTVKLGRDTQSQFGAYWFQRADGTYQYGLRSQGDFDVSKIAQFFGGGGHKNAAGFESETRVW